MTVRLVHAPLNDQRAPLERDERRRRRSGVPPVLPARDLHRVQQRGGRRRARSSCRAGSVWSKSRLSSIWRGWPPPNSGSANDVPVTGLYFHVVGLGDRVLGRVEVAVERRAAVDVELRLDEARLREAGRRPSACITVMPCGRPRATAVRNSVDAALRSSPVHLTGIGLRKSRPDGLHGVVESRRDREVRAARPGPPVFWYQSSSEVSFVIAALERDVPLLDARRESMHERVAAALRVLEHVDLRREAA